MKKEGPCYSGTLVWFCSTCVSSSDGRLRGTTAGFIAETFFFDTHVFYVRITRHVLGGIPKTNAIQICIAHLLCLIFVHVCTAPCRVPPICRSACTRILRVTDSINSLAIITHVTTLTRTTTASTRPCCRATVLTWTSIGSIRACAR